MGAQSLPAHSKPKYSAGQLQLVAERKLAVKMARGYEVRNGENNRLLFAADNYFPLKDSFVTAQGM